MNIREVLEIAVAMESDGINFYAKAAEAVNNASAKQILSELSDWEKKHYDTFSRIKDEIVADTDAIVSPDGEAFQYLNAFVTGAIFDANASPFEYIKPDCDTSEVLKVAIGLEKDAICYYTGIKMLFNDQTSANKIDRIINEEMEHVKILSEQLNLVLAKKA